MKDHPRAQIYIITAIAIVFAVIALFSPNWWFYIGIAIIGGIIGELLYRKIEVKMRARGMI